MCELNNQTERIKKSTENKNKYYPQQKKRTWEKKIEILTEITIKNAKKQTKLGHIIICCTIVFITETQLAVSKFM